MRLGVVISTYQRKDGKTPFFLKRCLESIKNQTHLDYKVFLIGDKYDDDDEFLDLATTIITPEKIYYENLPIAVEREKYSDERLWASGGVNACNYGIEKCLSENIEYICHLDHDDYWDEDFLFNINKETDKDYLIIATKGVHFNGKILPVDFTNPYYPRNSYLLHSATCVNFKKCKLRYRDVFSEEGRVYAADADLWNRMKDYMMENNHIGFLIDKINCYHETENQ